MREIYQKAKARWARRLGHPPIVQPQETSAGIGAPSQELSVPPGAEDLLPFVSLTLQEGERTSDSLLVFVEDPQKSELYWLKKINITVGEGDMVFDVKRERVMLLGDFPLRLSQLPGGLQFVEEWIQDSLEASAIGVGTYKGPTPLSLNQITNLMGYKYLQQRTPSSPRA